MLASGVQQSDSVMHIHVSITTILFCLLFCGTGIWEGLSRVIVSGSGGVSWNSWDWKIGFQEGIFLLTCLVS